ncbi:hypothetical protein O1L60_38190 [Streptomyces diastatochromogenes]|nr:hypothetical protein [Streptomyces diastatochromogenes]
MREPRALSAVRPQRPALPARVRPVFVPAAIASFAGFALFGVFTSVSPAFLARFLHVDNHAVSGLVVALAFFSSTAGQLAVGRIGVSRSLPLGCAVLFAGLAFLAGRSPRSCSSSWSSPPSSAGSGRASPSARPCPPSPPSRPWSSARR